MKKILFIAVTSACLLFTACSQDFLDIDQKGVQSTENTYANADDETVESFISSVYYFIYGDNTFAATRYKEYLLALECPSDNTLVGNKAGDSSTGYDPMVILNYSSDNDEIRKLWSYFYTTCYWCNLIIEKLPDNKVASSAVKEQVIAEARAIRAITMMKLVQLYGNPPLADKVLDGTEGNTPAEESWEFILSELKEVAESGKLPSKAGLGGQAAIGGRITTEAVYGFLGKAYLWKGDYSNAAQYLYKVIASNKYALMADYDMLNTKDANLCDEYLWEFNINPSEYNNSQAGGILPHMFNWLSDSVGIPSELWEQGGWGYGSAPTADFGEFMERHDIVNGVQDNRFRGTLVTYEDLFDDTRFHYSFNLPAVYNPPLYNNQGYLSLRHMPRANSIVDGWTVWINARPSNNMCYMRYSEVLLNYAEAVAMGGAAGSGMSGLEALNLVRRRAGLSDAPALDMNNETYGVKAEKRAELYMEGERFIDLVRWGDAASVLKDKGKYTYNFYGYKDGRTDCAQSKSQWDIKASRTPSNGWQDKHKLFPIPYIETLNNTNLTQNPGW